MKQKEATPLGKFLRRMRVDNDDSLRDLGKKIGLSGAYLSAVETGKVTPSEEWLVKITNAYKLDSEQQKEMMDAYAKTIKCFTVNYRNLSADLGRCCAMFLNNLQRFTDADAAKMEEVILGILESRQKGAEAKNAL